MGTPCFEYEPLLLGDIRLLRVVDCNDVWAKCNMVHVPLDGAIPWAALSYVWGNAGQDRMITLNGKEFWIRPNLLHALTAFHYNMRQDISSDPSLSPEAHTYVWIDAICINQSDEQEKAKQIRLMRQIYSQAEMVFVWLGRPTRKTDPVFKIFQWINYENVLEKAISQFNLTPDANEASLTTDAKGAMGNNDHHHGRPLSPHDLQLFSFRLHRIARILWSQYNVTCEQLMAFKMLVDGLDRLKADGVELTKRRIKAFLAQEDLLSNLFPVNHWFWSDFILFLNNAWYRRVWTMQEVLLSRSALVLCPKGIFTYAALECYTGILVPLLARGAIWESESILRQGVSLDSVMATASALEVRLPVPCPLLYLLRQASRRNATVKSDYVYALLGVSDPAIVSHVPVDYGQPPSIIFTRALKVALCDPDEARDLPLLWEYFHLTVKATPGLPSWCPDFSNSHNTASMFDSAKSWKIEKKVRQEYSPFAKVDIADLNTEIIGVAAFGVDTVLWSIKTCIKSGFTDNASDVLSDDEEAIGSFYLSKSLSLMMKKWLQACLDIGEPSSGNLGARINSLVVALAPYPPLKAFDYDLAKLLHFCNLIAIHGLPGFEEGLPGIPEEEALKLAQFLATIVISLDRKFLFKTTSGKLGFCRRIVQAGDSVVYVPGGEMLHVFSSSGTRYRGTAYVRGLMSDPLKCISGPLEDEVEMFYLT